MRKRQAFYLSYLFIFILCLTEMCSLKQEADFFFSHASNPTFYNNVNSHIISGEQVLLLNHPDSFIFQRTPAKRYANPRRVQEKHSRYTYTPWLFTGFYYKAFFLNSFTFFLIFILFLNLCPHIIRYIHDKDGKKKVF